MTDEFNHKPKLPAKRRLTSDRKDSPPLLNELNTRIKSNPLIKKFGLPATETLLDDFSCALYKQILLHGRLYISEHYVCFESKIFGIKTMEVIRFVDIRKILKKSKQFKFRFGIHITTEGQSYSFASFASRDKAFALLQQNWIKLVPDAHAYSDDEDGDDDSEIHQLTNTASMTSQDKTSDEEGDAKKTRGRARSFIKAALTRTTSKGLIERPKDLNPLTPVASNETSNFDSAASINLPPASDPIPIPSPNSSALDQSALDQPALDQSVQSVQSVPESTDSRDAIVEEMIDDCLISEGESISDDEGFLGAEDSQFHEVIHSVLDVNVVNFFRVFFSDRSNFTRAYHEHRGDRDIVVKPWTNSDQFGMIRDVLYVAPLKMTIGPDKTRVQETQRYHLQKNKLTLETVTNMLDIPYGDFFRMEANWQVSSVSERQCKVIVKIGCHFMKKTWFKSKIESSGIKESEKSYASWIALAQKELEKPESLLLLKPRAATTSSVSSSSPPPPTSTPITTPPPCVSAAPATAVPAPDPSVSPSPAGIIKRNATEARPRDRSDSLRSNLLAPLQNANATVFCTAFIVVILFFYMYGRIQHLEGRINFMESLFKEGFKCQMPPHVP